MPLHLLGKKSWNVYNTDNIARVRRDEAAAKASEEAEEQRMQEVDAQRRLAILRGEAPPPLEDEKQPAELPADERQPGHEDSAPSFRRDGSRKKRKRVGEDDTDFELRLAGERNGAGSRELEVARKPTSSAPIVDHAGHIDLFGDEVARAHTEKNEEAEREAKKKKQEYEDQYTMRFANAAGRDGLAAGPWYSQADKDAAEEKPLKNVWGRDDPKRKERDAQRMSANDPLAMMKQGASKVREINSERRKFQAEREEELRQMRREEKHKERRRKRDERHSRHRSRSRDGGRTDDRARNKGTDRDRDRERDRRQQPSRDRHDYDDDEYRRRRHRNDGEKQRRRSRSPTRSRHRH